MKKISQWSSGVLAILIAIFLDYVWTTTEHYQDIEKVDVLCRGDAPPFDTSKPLKVLSWNIQFLAGKNYIFFYDAVDGSGKDEAPSPEDTKLTLNEVTRVLRDEDPDIILLQEVDVDAKRTYHQNQVALLYEALADRYPCQTSTFYWRAGFAPHPNIMGSVGMKLATFSKYKMSQAQRHALGEFPANIIVRQFRPKRALLDTFIPTTDHKTLRIINTHLEAYSQGSNLMQHQVQLTKQLLDSLNQAKIPWLIGGDFNLLMPGRNFLDLSRTQRSLYQEHSELKALTDKFRVIPSMNDINGDDRQHWYTHFPNDPEVKGPDRTIDFIFYSQELHPQRYRVRSQDTLKISDHLPLIGEFSFGSAKGNTLSQQF